MCVSYAEEKCRSAQGACTLMLRWWDLTCTLMLRWREKNQIGGTQALDQVWRQMKRYVPFSLVYQRQKTKRNNYEWFIDYRWNNKQDLKGSLAKLAAKANHGKPTQTMRLENEAAKSTGKQMFEIQLWQILRPMSFNDEWQISYRNLGQNNRSHFKRNKEIATPPQFYTNPCKMAQIKNVKNS